MPELTQSRVRELFDYNPKTGILVRKISVGHGTRVGGIPGTTTCYGYVSMKVDGGKYQAHCIIWLWVTGEFPTDEIDHENHVRSDNRWRNLKEATRKQNAKNRKLNKNNKSGHVGVCWHTRDNKWMASIKLPDNLLFLGYFSDLEKAVAAREAASQIYGYHPNHGSS